MPLFHVIKQDIVLAWRQGNVTLVLAFLMIAVTLVPFGIGPELDLLRRLAPGLMWIILVLAVLLSLDRLFQSDVEDGHFDQLLLATISLEGLAMAKILAHFCAIILPLALALPIAGALLNIAPSALPILVLAVLAAGPALCALGAVGAALAVSVQRAGLLTALVVMPLFVPVLIFGASVTHQALADMTVNGLALLALFLISVAAFLLSPLAVAAALRVLLR
jgi:heme exporter protein B